VLNCAVTELPFVSRLRRVMGDKGLSRNDLVREAVVSPSAVDKWLTGTVPRDRTLKLLCANLRVRYTWLRDGIGDPYIKTVEGAPGSLPFFAAYVQEINAIRADYEHAREELKAKFEQDLKVAARRLNEKNEALKKRLIDTHMAVSSPVQQLPFTIQNLRERLNRIARAMGSQAELAHSLDLGNRSKVSPQRLNDWLKGRVEPSGDTALRLLAWVQAKEAEQIKSSEGAGTPSEKSTRLKESNYEKPKIRAKQTSRRRRRKSTGRT
jgi:transcriptional regulator with XRE-family HTH domain